jgi:hypothetical protein
VRKRVDSPHRRPAFGHLLNLLVAIVAAFLSGFVIYANKLLPTTLINKLEFDAIKQQLSYSYFATYQHMGPYCLGLLVGYLLRKQPTRLPKHLTWLLWLLLPPLSFTTLLLTYLWNGAYSEPNLINPSPLVSAVYVAIHRTIWSALVAWLVFACSTGRATLLSSFLSSSIFLPLSRLSYSIYLVHLPVIMFRSLNLRHTIEWTDQNILWEACGNFVVSLILGFFLNVAFESPIMNLEKVLFGKGRNGGAISSSCLSSSVGSKQHVTSSLYLQQNKLAATGSLSIGSIGVHPEKAPHPTASSGGGPQTKTTAAAAAAAAAAAVAALQAANKIPDSLPSTSSSNASDGCEDTNYNSTPPTSQELGRKSLRPKQSNSVEQIFGRAREVRHSRAASSTMNAATSRLRRQQELAANDNDMREDEADSYNDHDDDDDEENGARRMSGANNAAANDDQTSEGSSSSSSCSSGDQAAADSGAGPQDDLYTIGAEYRHYAPAGYQLWRRAMGAAANQAHRFDSANQGRRQPMASSNSMRSMQYATLSRTSRPRQDLQSEPLAAWPYGRGPHQMRRPSAESRLDRAYQQQQRFNEAAAPPDGYDDQLVARHEQLFPNSSELNFGHDPDNDARSTLIQQRQLLASRRRQGRYNTLTGTGTRDWRSQLQTRHQHLQQAPPSSEPMDGSTDAPPAWEQQQQQQRPWLPSGESGAHLGINVGPGLFIPRVDLSSTLRRQARAAGQLGAGHGPMAAAATGVHGQLLFGRQQQHQSAGHSAKIVEEQSPAEADETSAL